MMQFATSDRKSMTALEKILRANRWRIREGKMASDDTYGWNGAFYVPLDGMRYHVMIGEGMGFRHLSVVNAQNKIVPSWDIMC